MGKFVNGNKNNNERKGKIEEANLPSLQHKKGEGIIKAKNKLVKNFVEKNKEMSGIPTPRSGLARPTRLPAPGSLPRPAMSLGQNKRPLASSEVAGQASKKARSLSVMAPPSIKTTVPRKPNVSSTLSTRRPLATRNISSSALNKTVASSEPTAEKAKRKRVDYVIFYYNAARYVCIYTKIM